jgi:glyoxylase-like metal-dependent hydrolase (beta-lactamase superfamily II)
VELSDPSATCEKKAGISTTTGDIDFGGSWEARGTLPQTLDVFRDGSLLIVNAPGHLPGHINLLARGPDGRQIYMAGDACHDKRLLTGEKSIGEWEDDHGHTCCIHADRREAERTIERIRILENEGVEIIFAHDVQWENEPSNKSRFFGADE